ncbi:AfsR/SARP family transcriptional regulator [Sinomonas susongensis]|uniref:AfsR/SARP family transcriptional regulator n=1 Tax=Sinomonas susongensis TaxID=1324851 RepID=UPI001487041C|nr:BTAD domain-containing putative transcriptional regulator [Sinomonas susongensis]
MEWELRLLGCWQLLGNGLPVAVGIRQERLITALALMGQRPRSYLAGLLWPESGEQQAAGSLRSTVFKVRHQLPGLLSDSLEPIGLGPTVTVDVRRFRERAELVRAGAAPEPDFEELLFGAELLPGWYDDWVIFEQERLRALRVATLEATARQHLARDEADAAVVAARQAAAIEPLRESAQALVIRAQVQAGDTAGAYRTLEEFRSRLRDELGLEPSDRLKAALTGGSFDVLGLPAPLPARQPSMLNAHRQLVEEARASG